MAPGLGLPSFRVSPGKPRVCCSEGPCSAPMEQPEFWQGELAASPRWAANVPPLSGPRGHHRAIQAAANCVCLGTRDPAWSPSPDHSCSLLFAYRPALLDFSRAGCPYLLIFLNFCGLIDDLVTTPESATSCCLFPRYNLPLHCLSLNVIRGTFASGTFSCFCN